MKLASTPGQLSLLLLSLALSPLAQAQAQAQSPGWYGGLGVGTSRSNVDEEGIAGNLLGSGLTTTTLEQDNKDSGYKLFGGYEFGPRFALEGGYFNLGRFGFTATTSPAGALAGNIKVQGLNLDAVGRLPFTEKFSAFGRVGLTYVDTAGEFSGTGAVTVADPRPGKRTGGHKYGFGLQYDVTQAMALRVEAERYRVNDSVGSRGDVDLFSVGLLMRFGGKKQEPAPPPAQPAPVAVAAQPQPVAAPVPVPVPPPRVLKRVVIAVDNDFDFDKVSLSPSGKRTLDSFARDLKGLDYERITVIGNTDRIGTESYNMKLSQRRAESVKDYLIVSGAVPASKIEATGAGESDHRTVPGDCVGERATTRLIECLQPDRRVDIEVQGTR